MACQGQEPATSRIRIESLPIIKRNVLALDLSITFARQASTMPLSRLVRSSSKYLRMKYASHPTYPRPLSGYPANTARGQMSVCVSDFNDHAPRFTQPQANISIRIPEVGQQPVRHRGFSVKSAVWKRTCYQHARRRPRRCACSRLARLSAGCWAPAASCWS